LVEESGDSGERPLPEISTHKANQNKQSFNRNGLASRHWSASRGRISDGALRGRCRPDSVATIRAGGTVPGSTSEAYAPAGLLGRPFFVPWIRPPILSSIHSSLREQHLPSFLLCTASSSSTSARTPWHPPCQRHASHGAVLN
jgi:hypothetical protein